MSSRVRAFARGLGHFREVGDAEVELEEELVGEAVAGLGEDAVGDEEAPELAAEGALQVMALVDGDVARVEADEDAGEAGLEDVLEGFDFGAAPVFGGAVGGHAAAFFLRVFEYFHQAQSAMSTWRAVSAVI